MAQLDMAKIKKIEKQRNTIHSKVACTYTIFVDNGTKYFQIDTYGNSNRDMPEKISQSIQIDREAALFISKQLINEFDLKLSQEEFS